MLKSQGQHRIPNLPFYLSLPLMVSKCYATPQSVWLAFPPALQFLTRPPCDIDFSVCLIPWVNMLGLLVHKSHTHAHAHTLSPTTVTKQATGTLKIWFGTRLFGRGPIERFILHQALSGCESFLLKIQSQCI